MRKTEFKKHSGILSMAIFVIVAACLVSMIVLLINGAKPDIWDKNPQKNEGQIKKESSCRLERTPDYGQNYIDRIVFIADTSIYHIAESSVLNPVVAEEQVWMGVDNSLPLDYSIDIADIVYLKAKEGMSIAEASAIKKPEYIIITVGIENGVAYCGKERFVTYYSKLIDSITEASPKTKIILQSILPVSEAYEKENPSVTNYKIDRANGWIEALASEKELRYLDTASILKNENGYLDTNYDRGDGLRLNNEGYVAVVNYIRTHGYK
jgi:hypothetical protein